MSSKLDATLAKAVALLSTHGGRDKLAKVFHYGSRIAVWRLQRSGRAKAADRMNAFRLAIGNSRRVGYFFSFLGSVPGLMRAFGPDAEKDPFWWTVQLSVDVADFFYYFFDNLPFLADYGLVRMDPKLKDWM